MFKKLIKFTLAFMMIFTLVVPANAVMQDMWAKVYSWNGQVNARGQLQLTEINSGVMYVVMVRNSAATPETLTYYNNDAYTSLANPVTGTSFASDTISGDKIAFRVDPTYTSTEDPEYDDKVVDLIVVDQAGGYTAFVEDFDQYTHTIVIDQRPAIH